MFSCKYWLAEWMQSGFKQTHHMPFLRYEMMQYSTSKLLVFCFFNRTQHNTLVHSEKALKSLKWPWVMALVLYKMTNTLPVVIPAVDNETLYYLPLLTKLTHLPDKNICVNTHCHYHWDDSTAIAKGHKQMVCFSVIRFCFQWLLPNDITGCCVVSVTFKEINLNSSIYENEDDKEVPCVSVLCTSVPWDHLRLLNMRNVSPN